MARPRLFSEPLTVAARSKRYRARKRADDPRPITYRAPEQSVTKPAPIATKPFDVEALIG